jgi:hypothetical protein
VAVAHVGDAVEHGRRGAQRQQQPDAARHRAELQHRQRQRAVGDELALRDEDDARDGEHEHERQREQRIDCTVGRTVEGEDAGNREVHGQCRPAASRH